MADGNGERRFCDTVLERGVQVSTNCGLGALGLWAWRCGIVTRNLWRLFKTCGSS